MQILYIQAEKAKLNIEKQQELKRKNEVLEEIVKQFVGDNETEEVVESENQTVTIKQLVSYSTSLLILSNKKIENWPEIYDHRYCVIYRSVDVESLINIQDLDWSFFI